MINDEKIIDIDQGKNIDVNISYVRQSIIKLACDMEDTILNDKDICLDKSSSMEKIKEEFIRQMLEADDFIHLPANDLFLDQCLLFLAVRLVELRSQIWDFRTLSPCIFMRKDRKCRCFAGDCKYEGVPPKEEYKIICDIYEKEMGRFNKIDESISKHDLYLK